MIDNFHLQDGRVEFRWRRWRNKKRQEVSACLMVLFSGVVLLGGGGIAEAGPTGGQVIGGQGNIVYGGATTTIKQQSQVISINWQTFSTARNETVNFKQPNTSSLAINYVVGGVPSVLQGALNADGRVYILNSAGITFTGTSHVNVGALLATTAMTIDGDPTKKIDVKGSGSGKVINQGSIQVSNGGFAILAAPYVENKGFIKADLGTIALAGTNKFTLDLRGDGLINFVVPPEAVEKIKSDGARVGVNNTGTLQARSGQVLISASVATQVVNAAVNMSGVVDASAFAPNGKGGSVLITSEGDINLGGQVSAAGAGSGAGGQIITKAVGADNINRKAVMTAAGGNGVGQGGQIEVSGHDVLLSGDINPGSGGTLLIDPYNVTITAEKGFNDIAGGTVSEAFISKHLKHNVSVDIQASHDIVFAAAGNSHVLVGGNGNLTLDAANDILFSANDYVIETRRGAVTLTAGGDIGDPAHRLSVVSGEGNHGPGVNAAGDILLTAGNDIYVDTITATASRKGKVTASFSANAGGNFSAAGVIDVEAVAQGKGKGKGPQQASADIHITAGNDIILHGLTDLASVQSRGKGANLAAVADVDLSGGNLTDTGNVVVQATIASRVAHSVLADANLVIEVASAVQINGNVAVAAVADLSSANLVADHALMEIGANDVMVGAVNVGALASDRGSGNAVASALVDIHGSGSQQSPPFPPPPPLNLGSLTDRASANVGGVGAAKSLADVTIQMPGPAQVAGAIDVSANAHNFGGGPKESSGVAASANAELAFAAGETTIAEFITVGGPISVVAHGTNFGSGGAAAYSRFGLAGGVQLGDVLVDAVALNKGRHANGPAMADASFATGGFVGAGFNVNSVNVQALASNIGMGGAKATAIGRLVAGSGGPGSPPSISVPGGISVDVAAITGPNAHSNASALASLSLAAGGDHAGIGAGPIDVQADASDHGAGNAAASARTDLRIQSSSYVVGVGSLTDVANANNRGGGVAKALANAGVQAGGGSFGGAIDIGGDVLVAANGHDFSGIAASADAGLTLGFSFNRGGVNINGDISIIGRAINDADGAARSKAAVDFGGSNGLLASSIHIANVLVDALASERGAGPASASALTNIRAQIGSRFGLPSGSGNINIGSLVDNASAHAGGGAARSLADVTVETPGLIRIAGPVDVSAGADNSGNGPAAADGIAASANADLTLSARVVGLGGLGGLTAGDVSVAAHATNSGSGAVKGQSRFDLGAFGGGNLQNVLVDAVALNKSGAAAGGAEADASFLTSGFVVGQLNLNAVNLQAQASSRGTGGARAMAVGRVQDIRFTGSTGGISVAAGITINAIAVTGPHAHSNASALASLSMVAIGDFPSLEVRGPVDVEARAHDHGAGNAVASALTLLIGTGSLARVGAGSLTDVASADNWGGGSARALANAVATVSPVVPAGGIHIGGDIHVTANADDVSGTAASANAGLAFEFHGAEAVTVDGDISIIAHGTNEVDGVAQSRAQINFSAPSGAMASSVHLSNVLLEAVAKEQGSGAALASALADIQAAKPAFSVSAGNLSIGSLTDRANASNLGGGPAKAIANVTLQASGALQVAGPIAVSADAYNSGDAAAPAGGIAASANADVTLVAGPLGEHTLSAGDISVTAQGTNLGGGGVRAQGRLHATAGTGTGGIGLGNVLIDVTGLNAGEGGANGALATASLDAHGASLRLGAVDVQARASDHGAGDAVASALTDLAAVSSGTGGLSVGSLTDIASAENWGGGSAKALANAVARASGHFVGSLGVSAVVQARASDHGAGVAVASALTDLAARGSESNGRLGVGSLTDMASAENWGGGSAKALANVVGRGFGVFGNLSVSAVDVQARASDHGAGDAVASALSDLAGSGSHGAAGVGSVIDMASAENWGGGSAKALAGAGVRAGGGDFAEANLGKIDVQARASDHGTGHAVASALTDLRASGGTFGGAGLSVGSLTDIASANNWGGGSAKALANAASRSPRALNVGGDIVVTANAHDFSGAAATANAGLALKARGFGTGLVAVDGDISVIVHATNDADGEARSRAAVDISGVVFSEQIPGASVHIANLLVDALASERGAGAASASALTDIRTQLGSGSFSHSGNGNIAMGALTERASAVSLGGGTAKTLADVTLQAGQVQVGGDILVSANAQFIGGSGGGGASANAALAILSSGNVTIDGNVEVLSRATGASVDAAEANTLILANLTTGSIFINGRVTDLATASGGSDHALAILKMDARSITSGGELGLGDPIVRAKAGSAVAEWLVDSSGTAASDGAFVRVNIPPGF